MKNSPNPITELKPNEIFVFGSNLAGRHGAGAARYAVDRFGAVYGQACGLQGQSYALPTKSKYLITLSLKEIRKYVKEFLQFAKDNPDLNFLVTEIGCGLAGYSPKEIAPLFKPEIYNLKNVYLPKSFTQNL